MRMTVESNYAIKITELLAEKNDKMDAKSIAEKGDIPLRFCLKILRKLADANIVISYKGAKGGYALASSPDKITLKMVIEAVEGPFLISKCQGSEFGCTNAQCRLHSVYAEISEAFSEKLASYNFGEIVK